MYIILYNRLFVRYAVNMAAASDNERLMVAHAYRTDNRVCTGAKRCSAAPFSHGGTSVQEAVFTMQSTSTPPSVRPPD